jgi:hypothetical protein
LIRFTIYDWAYSIDFFAFVGIFTNKISSDLLVKTPTKAEIVNRKYKIFAFVGIFTNKISSDLLVKTPTKAEIGDAQSGMSNRECPIVNPKS